MKTKKILTLTMVAVLAMVSFIPSTFSWYTHNRSSDGNKINYSNDVPISIKSAANTVSEENTVSVDTYKSDANGSVGDTVTGGISLAPNSSTRKAVQYYKTILTNTGNNDVYVDLETNNMPNNADFVIGTVSPTINERAFASRAVRSKVSGTTTRIYFKPNTTMASYWSVDTGRLKPETGTYDNQGNVIGKGWEAGSSNQASDSTGTLNDINLSYTAGGKEYQVVMNRIQKNSSYNVDTNWSNTGTKVYYYDIPSNTESFYFFNHWYLRSDSNREWNRTLDITDTTAGRLYYLTGSSNDKNNKEYAVRPVDTDLVALNQYYSTVRMSLGTSVFADIGLRKTSDTDEDFTPDYYGSTITYSCTPTSVATINSDGLITPKTQGTATVTTTITGKFGDTKQITTAVNIPAKISEIPIIKNVRVPAQGTTAEGGAAANKVEIEWYAINKSATATLTTDSLYITI